MHKHCNLSNKIFWVRSLVESLFVNVKILSKCTQITSLKSLVTSDPNSKIWFFMLYICNDKRRKACRKKIIGNSKHRTTRNNLCNNPIEEDVKWIIFLLITPGEEVLQHGFVNPPLLDGSFDVLVLQQSVSLSQYAKNQKTNRNQVGAQMEWDDNVDVDSDHSEESIENPYL